ncbi:MAG: beta-lactamase family protein, partial [Clostridia bacterium]|nr:beta-lactamase family protein [Clostridia bacterium]
SGVFNSSPLSAAMVEAMPREAYRDVSTVAAYCSRQPLVFEPGTRTAYTGSASFDIIAALIERKSGMKFSDFVRRELLDPLGLDDLTYTPTEDQWARLITMHDRADSKTLVAVDLGRHVYEGFPLTYTRAGGGSMGSLDAYCRFAEFLRRGGELDGVRLLSPELCSKLSTPWIPDGIPGRNPTESWGLGVRVIVHDAHLPVGSFGWSGAYGTHFWIDPENEITAVFMKNSFHYDAGGGGRSGVQFESDVMGCLKGA